MVAFLQGEMRRVLELIGTLGEPRPDQAAKLLTLYTSQVTGYIPFSPPEVKSAVVESFRKCNWDVLRRRPVPGSHPPNGKVREQQRHARSRHRAALCARTGQRRALRTQEFAVLTLVLGRAGGHWWRLADALRPDLRAWGLLLPTDAPGRPAAGLRGRQAR